MGFIALLQLVSGDNETKQFILTVCRTGTVNRRVEAPEPEAEIDGPDIVLNLMISRNGLPTLYSSPQNQF